MAAQMHYREYEYIALANAIDNAVWKAVHETAPNFFLNDRPGSWVVDNILNGGENLD